MPGHPAPIAANPKESRQPRKAFPVASGKNLACVLCAANRPLVIPDRARVEIGIRAGDDDVYLTLDGQIGLRLKSGDRIVLERSKHRTCLLSSPRRNYFDILRSKLHWGDVPSGPARRGGRIEVNQ